MKKMRKIMEHGFEIAASWIYDHRLMTLVMIFVIAGLFISQLPKIRLDTKTEGFLRETDQTLIDYKKLRDQFGRVEQLVIAVYTPDVFNLDFLNQLKSLHDDLAADVPHLHKITSLVNVRNTRGSQDRLYVDDLMAKWPESARDVEALKRIVENNPLYQDLIISKDHRMTIITIESSNYSTVLSQTEIMSAFDQKSESGDIKAPPSADLLTDRENSEMVEAVTAILKKHYKNNFVTYMAGMPVVEHSLKTSMMRDMSKFMRLAVITTCILLFIFFRRVSGVILPMLIVILTLLSTLGLMAAFKAPLKLPTQILPSFLLVIGIGDAVHILALFYKRYQHSGDKKASIVWAVGHSGLAITVTSITTIAGLLSLATADVAPIADLGIFAGGGVGLAWLYTVLLLPSLISLIPIKSKIVKNEASAKRTFMEKLLAGIGRVTTQAPYMVMLVSVSVIVFALFMIPRNRFSHDVVRWFKPGNEVRIAIEKIDKDLKGSANLEIIIDTGKENGLFEPQFLNHLEAAADYLKQHDKENVTVGKAWSIADLLKEIHRALNENQNTYYSIPKDRKMISQEFLLFENSGSDDLEDFTDSQFSKARLTARIPMSDAVLYSRFVSEIRSYMKDAFPGDQVVVSGLVSLYSRVVTNAIHSLARSYTYAIIVVSLLMILLIGNIKMGLLSMIPNLFPFVMLLGIMGSLQLPMDLFILSVGCIALGLAVDDTIHFMHTFKKNYDESNDMVKAITETLQTVGRAMIITSIALAAGFFIFVFSEMNNFINFGLLNSLTILAALMADLFVFPALLMVIYQEKAVFKESRVSTKKMDPVKNGRF